MIKFFRQKNNKGFTLVETLIAISVFTLSIVALMSFLSQNISNTGYAKKKIIAAYLAQEGIEYIRNMRDNYILYTGTTSLAWNDFIGKISPCDSSNDCGFDSSISFNNPNSVFLCSAHTEQCKLYVNNGDYNTNLNGIDSGFVREIRMASTNLNEIKIFSTVSWSQGVGVYSITFSDSLFNWVE